MLLSKLNQELSSKLLRDFYLFQGVEGIVRDMYIDKICKLCGKLESKIKVDTLDSAIRPKGLVSNNIYIVVDDKSFIDSPKLWAKLREYKGTPIILYFNSIIDKRSKFYKEFSEDFVSFNYLEDDILENRIIGSLGSDISDKNAHIIVKNCSNNYGYILNECEKIKDYSKMHKLSPNLAFIELLENGGITIKGDIEILDFATFLVSGNVSKVFELLPNINKSENIKNLSLLYTIFKNEYIVRSTKKPTPSNTGLTYGAIKNVLNHNQAYSIKELEYAMNTISNAIKSIKEGKLPNDLALDCVVVKII